jgi:CBS domain containing-hemolysin-like protein
MNPFWLAVSAAVLVALAGLFSAAEAAISSFSRARAEELSAEGRPSSCPVAPTAGGPAC